MIVYRITNLVTGKVYIGITRHSAEKRFREHWYDSLHKHKSQGQRYLLASMRKYERDCWSIETIAAASSWAELCALEIKLIAEHRSNQRQRGYNCSAGGEGTLGIKHTEEQRRKRSARMKGRTFSTEHRKALSAALKGKPKSADHVAKSVAARLAMNFKKTPEQIEKSARFHRGRKRSPQTRQRLREAMTGNTNGRFTARPFCGRGHPMSGENLYFYTTASGKKRRVCRTCMIANNLRQSARRWPKQENSNEPATA